MRSQQYEYAFLEYDEEANILFYRVKQDQVVDIHEMNEMLRYVEEFMGYKRHFAVIDFGESLLSTNEARELYAKSEYLLKYRIADAFLVKSLPIRIVANFFLRVTKPKIVTKLFDKEADAVIWLQKMNAKQIA